MKPEEIESAINKKAPEGTQKQVLQELENIYRDNTPRIAFIGKSGVGKTSTINALFNPIPPLPIGHVKATTKKPYESRILLGRDRGHLDIVDMPGLGESIYTDPLILDMYARILPECDASLWILQANERSLGDDQKHINDAAEFCPDLKKKLVIGLNQVDIIGPGNWNKRYNIPSLEQAITIQEKIDYVHKNLNQIDVEPQSIVPYSALKKYRLTSLFRAILEAVPIQRAWLLGARADIESYTSPRLAG